MSILFKTMLVLVCTFPIELRGQTNSVFMATSFTFSSVYSPSLPELVGFSTQDDKMSITPEIGFRYFLSKHVNIKVGMLLEERGWHSNITTFDTSSGNFGSRTKANYAYIFLTTPLRMEIMFGKKYYCFVNSGINISQRTGGGIKLKERNSLPLTLIYPDIMRPFFDISLSLAGGVGIPLTSRTSVYFEGSYFHGFTPIGKYSEIEGEFYHRGYRIGIGVDIKVQP